MSTVRLLLVAHAPLASALRETALHAFPECAQGLQVLDVAPEASLTSVRAACHELLHQDPGRPLLALVDVGGATPANALQAELSQAPWARAVVGVNVAMLWRTLCYRHEDVDGLLLRALEGAQRGTQALSANP